MLDILIMPEETTSLEHSGYYMQTRSGLRIE